MFKKIKSLFLVTLMVGGTAVGCTKQENSKEDKTKVTLVLSVGGVNDQSFNQGAWEGAEKAAEELGVEVSYLESNSDADYIANIETAVDKDSDLVVGVGFQMGDAIKEAAEAYPEQQFAIIDNTYEEKIDNVRSITFNEEQAGYLTGLIAAKMTKTNVIGWIGGLDIPSCSNFYVGYEKGAKEVNPDIKVLKQFTNSFTDAAKGRVVAEGMVKENADIIFMASGGGNAGTLEVVRENNIKAIGVDMANAYLAPDHIITSALKNVGEGLKLTIKDFVDGKFTGGEVKYDLTNGGVGFEKTDLLSDEIIKFVEDKIKNM
jgi:basic membrane protein A